jgi:hypothetical protein
MKTTTAQPAPNRFIKFLASLGLVAGLGGSSVIAQSCTNPPAGLVGWWSGDGHFFDLAGTNHVTAGAGVSFVPGKVGQAFKFVDAVDSWVQLPNSPAFQPTNNELTIEAWVKPDFTVTGNKIDTILAKRDGCNNAFSYMFGVSKGHRGYTGNVWIGLFENVIFWSTNTVPDDGQFHHVAATFDGNKPNDNCRLYLDGQIAGGGDAPGAIPGTSTGPVMGKHAECGYYSSTAIDELGFYNRELSAAEIQAIYAAGSAGKCKLSTLAVSLTGGGILLSWPASAEGFGLVFRADLTAGSWEAVTNEPALNGNRKEVLLPANTPAQRFFRLKMGN